jgi:hypothetical protein
MAIIRTPPHGKYVIKHSSTGNDHATLTATSATLGTAWYAVHTEIGLQNENCKTCGQISRKCRLLYNLKEVQTAVNLKEVQTAV